MDRIIRAGFYRVTPPDDGQEDFPDLLLKVISGSRGPKDRQREIADGVTIRLERCTASGEFVQGEFCRKQVVGMPPTADDDGLAPLNLGKGKGLGHVAAFIYHKPTRVLVLEANKQSATPMRIGLYLASSNVADLFGFEPILRLDAWVRFKHKKIRTFRAKFAAMDNLDAVDVKDLSVSRGVRLLGEAFNAPVVEIKVSAGRSKKKSLNLPEVKDTITKIMSSSAEVRALEVRADGDDKIIDFLGDSLRAEEELALPETDTDAHYSKRITWLKARFGEQKEYLEKQFKPVKS